MLTQEQFDTLAYVVADPQAWADHAIFTIGQEAVDAKVERWREEYLVESAKAGYLTRAERDAIATVLKI